MSFELIDLVLTLLKCSSFLTDKYIRRASMNFLGHGSNPQKEHTIAFLRGNSLEYYFIDLEKEMSS